MIYFGDLTHTTVTVSNDAFPLNVGYVASYFNKQYPEKEIRLFKYPEELIRHINNHEPSIIALSNYPWNINLSIEILKLCKRINSSIITVMGGPNMSYVVEEQERFLKKYSDILDFYIMFEGEKSFLKLYENLEKCKFNLDEAKLLDMYGVIYLRENKISKFNDMERMKGINDNPSPFLSGVLDVFFDGKLTPMIETHRGCPYSCTFCHEGAHYYRRIHMHFLEKVTKELYYIAKNISGNISNLIISDPNFGIYDEHIELAKVIREIYEKYNWPKIIYATTAKNAQKRLIEITEILGNDILFPISMSVQTLDKQVLGNIKRRNIAIEDMYEIQKNIVKKNKDQFSRSELILSLPGETLEAHVDSLVKLVELGIDIIYTYQLMMVNGSEISLKDESRIKYNIKTKYRILPRSFTKNKEIGVVIETEEIATSTKDLSFDDYLTARKIHLMISVFYNSRVLRGFYKFIIESSVSIDDFLLELLKKSQEDSEVNELFEQFANETINELFDSEEEILEFASNEENYHDIVEGKFGSNLILKYTSLAYLNNMRNIVKIIKDTVRVFIKDDLEKQNQLKDIFRYYVLKYSNYLAPNRLSVIDHESFSYDIEAWMNSTFSIESFSVGSGIKFKFYTPKEQFNLVEGYLDRYGRNIQAFGKIMTILSVFDLQRAVEIQK